MIDDSIVSLVRALAWPTVAFAGVIVLGPLGYLEKFAKILFASIADLNKAVTEFRDSTLTLRHDMEAFRGVSGEVSREFSAKLADVNAQLLKTGETLDEISRKADRTIEISGASLRETLADEQQEVDPEFDSTGAVNSEDQYQQVDAMFDEMVGEWNQLVEKLKIALGGKDFDARQIATMATRLMDGRRKNAIDAEAASQIGRLHSQFKRFMRLQSTRDEWLTPELQTSFIKQVRAARRILA